MPFIESLPTNITAFSYNSFCFIIYSILGWIGEVIYAAFVHKRFVNRGFLNGPYCPIYGAGALCFGLVQRIFKTKNVLILFFTSALFASVIEYIAGYLLEKIFKRRYWDYSDVKYNIKGYICLSATLVWGIAGIIAVFFIFPFTHRYISLLSNLLGTWAQPVMIVLRCIFFLDVLFTVFQNLQLNKRLAEYYELSKAKFEQKKEEAILSYEQFIEQLPHGNKRILNAFPKMKSDRFDEALSAFQGYQERLRIRIKEEKKKNRKAANIRKERYEQIKQEAQNWYESKMEERKENKDKKSKNLNHK